MRLSVGLIVVFVGIALLTDDSGRYVWWGGALLLAFGLWPRLIVDEDGLTVVNIRAHRYRWTDLSGVGWRRIYPLLDLQLVGGGHRVVWAVGVGRGGIGRWWANQTYSLIYDRWRLATGQLPPILEQYVR